MRLSETKAVVSLDQNGRGPPGRWPCNGKNELQPESVHPKYKEGMCKVSGVSEDFQLYRTKNAKK